jgi:hypothetical protein
MIPFAALAAGSDSQSSASSISTPLLLDLQTAFTDSLAQVVGAPQIEEQSTLLASAMQTHTVDGDCGGSATYSVDHNESSGSFSGSFRYNGFCTEGVNISGRATFSGRIDPDTEFFDYFSFTFSSLTTTIDGQSNTVSGSLDCDFQGSDIIIAADMKVRQSSNGPVCWLNNYSVQVTGTQMEISGRYYNPEHGYVTITTIEPLTIASYEQFPSSGEIEFTGATGPGGNPTKARLIAISSTQCQVIADTDGDGELDDYDSDVIFWTEL